MTFQIQVLNKRKRIFDNSLLILPVLHLFILLFFQSSIEKLLLLLYFLFIFIYIVNKSIEICYRFSALKEQIPLRTVALYTQVRV